MRQSLPTTRPSRTGLLTNGPTGLKRTIGRMRPRTATPEGRPDTLQARMPILRALTTICRHPEVAALPTPPRVIEVISKSRVSDFLARTPRGWIGGKGRAKLRSAAAHRSWPTTPHDRCHPLVRAKCTHSTSKRVGGTLTRTQSVFRQGARGWAPKTFAVFVIPFLFRLFRQRVRAVFGTGRKRRVCRGTIEPHHES